MSDDTIHGEETIIQEFLAPLAAGFPGAFGLRDDAALLSSKPDCDLVATVDPLIAGVHFLADAAPEDIAWRALAVNVSDLAAKGAEPFAYVMTLALPEPPERSWMGRFAAGLSAAQSRFGCHLAGGDTDRTPGLLTVAITAFGSVPKGAMVRRATAKPGDRLFVTGTLGDAALGLELLKHPDQARALGLSDADAARMAAHFLRPEPRLAMTPLLRAYASAAMDISDGLAKDCGRMCAAGGTGARVRVADLPLSDPLHHLAASDPPWLGRAIAGGDDYELLVAVPDAKAAAFATAGERLDFPVTCIGEITQASGIVLERPDGSLLRPDRAGWEHFE